MGTNIDLNTESLFSIASVSRRLNDAKLVLIIVLALPGKTSNSSSCHQSLVNATPRYLNFSTCFNNTSPTCREHWTGLLKRCSTSVLKLLIFIPAMSHAAVKPFNARKKPAKVNHLRKATY